MLNPVKIHDSLWSISLASMFNWSSASVSVRPVANTGSGGSDLGEGDCGKVVLSAKDPSRQSHTSLYHNFPFAANFNLLSRTETCKENIMKQAGGKSFTIDSLLGINAAQVAIQNRFHTASHSTCHGEENEGSWLLEKRHHLDHAGRQNRTTSYHSLSRKERNNPYANAATTEKSGDKPQKTSRRSTKSKRVRTIFTPDQLERLEAEFERQQYMVGPERLYLASSLYLTEAQVKVWFQNRRIKWRKQHLEMQQQRLAIFRSKGSHVENGEEDLYDEESDEDASKSEPLPTSDSSPSNAPLLTSFAGSLLQEQLSETESDSNKMLPDCSRSQQTSISKHSHNNVESHSCGAGSDGPTSGGGRDSLSAYMVHQQSSLFE